MFDTTKEDLKDILRKIDEGKLQLPEFQRDYVWGDEDVTSLIASIAKGFPVGALLTLENGGEVKFKPRLLTGVNANPREPDELLLDGQQRLTSLYQSMFAKAPVRTRTPNRTEIERFYYLDIKKAIGSSVQFDEVIRGVPADKIERTNFGKTIKLDLSSRQAEFEHDMFPLNMVFDSRDWFYGWRDHWKAKGRDVFELDKEFVLNVVDKIERYKMPIIRLDKGNKREAICLVFEKVNVGGKKLDAFELVTAIYASDNFDLREDWEGKKQPAEAGRKARMIGSPNRRDVLTQVASTDFLQVCTLLHTREVRESKRKEDVKDRDLPQVSCKREALLGLPLAAYKKWAAPVEAGFIEAGGYLNEWKIVWHRDVPYPPLIVGLASVFAILGHKAQTAAAKQKLSQWLWSVTLGELYGSTTESRLSRDVPELVEWIGGQGGKPRSVDEALFQQDRLNSLQSRLSAAYKGIHALLMQQGCRDFITGRGADLMTFFNDQIDIHHVFPQAWCKKKGIKSGVFNSIINKTPLSKRSNIVIGGDAPSVYLKRIEEQEKISSAVLDDILRTHLIEPMHLRNDDFEAFYKSRSQELGTLIANAMGKPVVEDHGKNEKELEVSDMTDIEIELEEKQEAV
jgi:hypothetical protein